MRCTDVRDLLTEHALGLVPAGEAKDVERHLRWCTGCRKELGELQEGMESVARSLTEATPRPAVEERVVHAVAEVAGRRSPMRRRTVRGFAVATMSAVLVAGTAVGWGVAQRHQAVSEASRVRQIQTRLGRAASVIDRIRTAFNGKGELSQATLFPGPTPRDGGGTALVFSGPKGADFVFVEVAMPLDPKRGPYSVQLLDTHGQPLPSSGRLAKTNNGDFNFTKFYTQTDLSRTVTVEIADRTGQRVMAGTLHRFIDTPPTP
jgi:hypothetical protein